MCGITGILAFNEIGRMQLIHLENATRALSRRGPDFHQTYLDNMVGLGHRRLSVIDTSPAAHQPMQDESGRYTIIFNGEIYNYLELKQPLLQAGVKFKSESDTEVLLNLYKLKGEQCLHDLNGFFAFAIYDKEEQSLFLARDRMGIKPLIYYQDEDKFLFGSEMKAMLEYGIRKEINFDALSMYLELNYLPAPFTMLRGIKKLRPGHSITIKGKSVRETEWYKVPEPVADDESASSYESASKQLQELLDKAVQRRLVADVPIGAFLSGGIDSSVITALASRHVDQLNTFSIGYRDDKFFDETHYANLVSKKFNTNHTVFSLTQDDLINHLNEIVDYIDDPFADSSAVPVYILSKETRKHATVALSGDGADELFSGYNKHAAWLKATKKSFSHELIKAARPLWSILPKSRSGKVGNMIRQLERFSKMLRFDERDRYWFLATFQQLNSKNNPILNNTQGEEYSHIKEKYLSYLKGTSMNHFLWADTHLVLPNDMLTKVDLMSMANKLEVRVPFLDHEVVEFANKLPSNYKINNQIRKRILQETYKEILPTELFNRPKKGFEVPLLSWFRNQLKAELETTLFNRTYLEDQGIFNSTKIMQLRKKLYSFNPGDSHAQVWALYVFQKWYRRYMVD